MHRSIVHIRDAKICNSPYIIIGAVLTDATLQMQGYYIMSHEILYNSYDPNCTHQLGIYTL